MENTNPEKQNRSKEKEAFKVGKIAILGRPNAGKSTLVNALLESELCATSNRPQTTRRKILGVVQRMKGRKWAGQLILTDTPGINFQKGALERSFFNSVEEAMSDIDAVLWLADARSFEKDLMDLEMDKIQEDRVANWMQQQLRASEKPWILVLNKADLVGKAHLLPLIERALKTLPQFKDVVPIAAALGTKSKDSNLETLLKVLDQYAQPSEPLFDRETFTDTSSRELVREFIREAIFRTTKKEVPYESECQIARYQEAGVAGKKAEIDAVIWVSRPSLKGILVGAQGQKIKEIGMTARKRFEELTGEEIILRLFVKVVDRWERKAELIDELFSKSAVPSRAQGARGT